MADPQRLARLCGKGVAHELCLTGEMITAEERTASGWSITSMNRPS